MRVKALVIAGTLAALPFSAAVAEPISYPVGNVDSLPQDAWGQAVRMGRDLINQTYQFIGPEVKDPAKRFAGNNLACTSCHIGGGTQAFAMPLVGVHARYPKYGARSNAIGSLADRINGCMVRSMNGRPLPEKSPEMAAMLAYMAFLSTNVPFGQPTPGQGTQKIALPNRAANPVHGKAVFAEQCAACHGADGQGQRRGKVGDAQGYQFPPLWGPDSFNDGAGMARLRTATAFIHANMPFGTHYDAPVLSIDDAYDVAAFVESQPRPVKANKEKDYPILARKPVDSAFPPYADSFPAAQHKYGPFQPLLESQKKALGH